MRVSSSHGDAFHSRDTFIFNFGGHIWSSILYLSNFFGPPRLIFLPLFHGPPFLGFRKAPCVGSAERHHSAPAVPLPRPGARAREIFVLKAVCKCTSRPHIYFAGDPIHLFHSDFCALPSPRPLARSPLPHTKLPHIFCFKEVGIQSLHIPNLGVEAVGVLSHIFHCLEIRCHPPPKTNNQGVFKTSRMLTTMSEINKSKKSVENLLPGKLGGFPKL